MEKLIHGEDGTIIKFENAPEAFGLSDLIMPIPDAPMSQDVYQVNSIIMNDIYQTLGLSSYIRGGKEPGVDTATEAALIGRGSDMKLDKRINKMELFCEDIGEYLAGLIMQYATQEQVVPIVGEDGKEMFQRWTKETIQGEFFYSVEAHSTRGIAEHIEKKQAMELFQLMGTVANMFPPEVLYEVAKTAVEKFNKPHLVQVMLEQKQRTIDQIGMTQQAGLPEGGGEGGALTQVPTPQQPQPLPTEVANRLAQGRREAL
jgi:hypothetical protein